MIRQTRVTRFLIHASIGTALAAMLGACQSNSSTPQHGRSPRPLWAETVRAELNKPVERAEYERFSRRVDHVLDWDPPVYRPIETQTLDSIQAWKNVLTPK